MTATLTTVAMPPVAVFASSSHAVGGRPAAWHVAQHLETSGCDRVVVLDGALGVTARIKQIASQFDASFVVALDGALSDVDLDAMLRLHRAQGRIATVMAVRPPARFGKLAIDDGRVVEFAEKPQLDEDWISGGVYVFEPAVADYIDDKDTQLDEALERLARDGQLTAYTHESFWQELDTLRDRKLLESLWQSGYAPWKTGEEA